MCRLFALHAGERDVAAQFWLLDAPTSIARQSEKNADGYGMAALTSRRGMILIRNPVQASEDPAYRQVARRLDAAEMLVHLRYASTGNVSLVNTHPFSQDGRLFAHNGVVGDLDRIEARLGPNRAMVMGDTDSERFFALTPLVVIASERISDEPGWEEIHPGELIHVGADLEVDREMIVSGPPAHPMVLCAYEQKTQSYD